MEPTAAPEAPVDEALAITERVQQEVPARFPA